MCGQRYVAVAYLAFRWPGDKTNVFKLVTSCYCLTWLFLTVTTNYRQHTANATYYQLLCQWMGFLTPFCGFRISLMAIRIAKRFSATPRPLESMQCSFFMGSPVPDNGESSTCRRSHSFIPFSKVGQNNLMLRLPFRPCFHFHEPIYNVFIHTYIGNLEFVLLLMLFMFRFHWVFFTASFLVEADRR